jgi:putative ABC transport system ATP-binding protein
MAVVLEACDLSKVFGKDGVRVRALCDVQLQVHSGEFLAVVGPSGSGKSTLLHLLGGLDTPTTGEVLLEGRSLGKLDDEQRSLVRRRRIGFVFQKINLLPFLTAQENVALPLLIDGLARSEAMERARSVLASVEMDDRVGHLPAALSGGEQQRVAVARALVIDPAVILADEPTGALDQANGQRIMQLLRSCVQNGRTVIMVTHDQALADQTDRRVVVRDGRLTPQSEPSGVVPSSPHECEI